MCLFLSLFLSLTQTFYPFLRQKGEREREKRQQQQQQQVTMIHDDWNLVFWNKPAEPVGGKRRRRRRRVHWFFLVCKTQTLRQAGRQTGDGAVLKVIDAHSHSHTHVCILSFYSRNSQTQQQQQQQQQQQEQKRRNLLFLFKYFTKVCCFSFFKWFVIIIIRCQVAGMRKWQGWPQVVVRSLVHSRNDAAAVVLSLFLCFSFLFSSHSSERLLKTTVTWFVVRFWVTSSCS